MTDKKYIISLESLGFGPEFEVFKAEIGEQNLARVIAEHKERYIVKNENGEYIAEVIGNLRFSAHSRFDFPSVGDWVSISVYEGGKAFIHRIANRKNALKRQAVGKDGEEQIIAANINYAFVVEAVNRDFNINRFQRFLTICYEADIEPILILNKIDLIGKDKLSELSKLISSRIPNVDLITTSCYDSSGISALREAIQIGKTYCFLGSSGVGKSTLVNRLSGAVMMQTNSVSETSDRGKHTTSHRHLVVLKEGGLLIDNPGMREVGIANAQMGLESSFQHITRLSETCHFKDCAHRHEKGCAVLKALENGEIGKDNYQNYLKMQRETEHFEASELDRKQKGKKLSKLIKHVNNRRT
ncbi:ribosome biogenesis GTPase [Saccharicrinis carchari]|uniref:Small ribosomal subunit biogenesis GTPase RsgA n=1 Tax=Saccharicrinis carchari TaxID=1168039 RepID=A0A521D859_SACCC|nr:ribosome small subunit-dependent GTPase A [Saccharicrinis carchari]SMO67080.1 ribosome biogenesis GTPase [Saccharicrinis carchari]